MRRFKETFMGATFFMVVLFVVILISVATYKIKRSLNWSWYYESQTQRMIDKSMEQHLKKYHGGENK